MKENEAAAHLAQVEEKVKRFDSLEGLISMIDYPKIMNSICEGVVIMSREKINDDG